MDQWKEKELPWDPQIMDQIFTNEKRLGFETYEERIQRWKNEEKKGKMIKAIKEIIKTTLTPKEVQAFRLYYIEGKKQEEVGRKMGICHQRVSQLLNNGFFKICEICKERDIRF